MAVMPAKIRNSTLHSSVCTGCRLWWLVCIAPLRTLCVVNPGDSSKQLSYPRCLEVAENSPRGDGALEDSCTYSELKYVPSRDQRGEACPVCAAGLFQDIAQAISHRVFGD